MKARPILMSAPMVQAILASRKTQTRRVVKLPTKTHSGGSIYERPYMGGWEPTTFGGAGCFKIGSSGERLPVPESAGIWNQTTGVCMALSYDVGDILWVRETFCEPFDKDFRYRADPASDYKWSSYDASGNGGVRWKPSIFMPRDASRITLEVTGVRVERLQNISLDDAVAEGIERIGGEYSCTPWKNYNLKNDAPHCMNHSYPPASYKSLWESINGAGSWDANPWVWVIEFNPHLVNVDEFMRGAS
jgi:hypothetical protein